MTSDSLRLLYIIKIEDERHSSPVKTLSLFIVIAFSVLHPTRKIMINFCILISEVTLKFILTHSFEKQTFKKLIYYLFINLKMFVAFHIF